MRSHRRDSGGGGRRSGQPAPRPGYVAAGLAGTFGEAFLGFLGLELPPIRAIVPTALKSVEFIDMEMDYVFELSTGEYVHLEFQDRASPSELRRFALYDAVLLRQAGRRVWTVVLYTGGVRAAPDVLDGGSLAYRVQNIYLMAHDGEAALAQLRSRVERGERLSRQDAVRLALVPLMRLGPLSVEAAAATALHLVRGVAARREQAVLAGTIIGLSGRFLAEDAVGRLIELARTTTPFDDLLAQANAQGEARGEARGRAAEGATMLLRVLRARFGEPGPALCARIVAERDPARLEAWMDAALESPDLARFVLCLGEQA